MSQPQSGVGNVPIQTKGQVLTRSKKEIDLPKGQGKDKDKRRSMLKRNKAMEKHFYDGHPIMTEE